MFVGRGAQCLLAERADGLHVFCHAPLSALVDYAVQKLLEKELIEPRGKAETVGRPMRFGTTARFMQFFGLNALRDLPQLRDVGADEDAAPVVGSGRTG